MEGDRTRRVDGTEDLDDSIVVAKNGGRDIPSSSSSPCFPFAVQTNVNCLVSPKFPTAASIEALSKMAPKGASMTHRVRALSSFAYLQSAKRRDVEVS